VSVVQKVCLAQARDRGFTGAHLTAAPAAQPLVDERERLEKGLQILVQRAGNAGRLCAGVGYRDMILLFVANSGIAAGSSDDRIAASSRLVAHMLRALQAHPADDALPHGSAMRLLDAFGGSAGRRAG
jgi:hypothetical protein